MIFRALVGSALLREKLRTAMTLFAVAIGVALVLAIDLANATAVASFARSVNIVSRQVNLQVLAIGAGFDEEVYPHLLALPGVRDARPIIESSLTVGARTGAPMSGEVLHIIGTDLLRPLPHLGEEVEGQASAGMSPDTLVNGGGVIISERIAHLYHLQVGSRLQGITGDRAIELPIAGILPSGVPGIDSSVVFVDMTTAQERFHHLRTLDRIDLEVDPRRLTQIREQLSRLLPKDTRVLTPSTRNGEIERMLQSFTLNLQALAAIALLVGLFLVFNTVAISVVQRRSEIGILRGLGATRGAILRSFLQEGLVFGLGGSLLGMFIGVFLAERAVGAVTKTVAALYLSTHADGVVYSLAPFIKALLLGIGSSVLAAVLPACEAATLLPAAMMRTGATESRALWKTRSWLILAIACALLAFLLASFPAIEGIPVCGYLAAFAIIASGCALTLPLVNLFAGGLRQIPFSRRVSSMLAASNMLSARGRVSIAMSTLVISIGMMVSIAVLIGSFRTTVVAWANESLRADLFIRPMGNSTSSGTPALSAELEGRLRGLAGVAALDTFRGISIPYQGRITTLAATEMRALVERPRLQVLSTNSLGDVADKIEHGPWALVSEPFVNRFHVQPGQSIRIPTPQGPTVLHIAAVYNDYSSDGGVILIDRTLFAQFFHSQGSDSIAMYAQPGRDLAVLRTAILRAALPAQIEVESTRELRKEVILIFDQTFAITSALYVITIAVAALGIVSTLFALVLERKREIGILRYLGLTVDGVRKMILVEAMGIGLIGGTLGVVVGVALALDLIYVINRQSFGWLIELSMPWAFLGETIALVVFATLLAGLIPAKIAARIRTAEVLRAE